MKLYARRKFCHFYNVWHFEHFNTDKVCPHSAPKILLFSGVSHYARTTHKTNLHEKISVLSLIVCPLKEIKRVIDHFHRCARVKI